jgi:threonine/homoserine/homoserine lactone efflux protein
MRLLTPIVISIVHTNRIDNSRTSKILGIKYEDTSPLEKYSLLQNILLGLTLAAPIGPVNLEIIKRGLSSGFKQAFLTGVGATSADTTYLIVIYFGLTAFLNLAFMKIILGFAGSIILIYLGIVSVKEFFYRPVNPGKAPQTLFRSSFVTGYLLAISSPMTIVWWTGVFGALLATQTETVTNLWAFFSCMSILLGCFLWAFCLALALHFGKKYINKKTTGIISLIAGLFLVGFGLYFGYQAINPLIRGESP